jgi:hypothetical protein
MDRPQIYGRLTEAFATWVRAGKRINFGDVPRADVGHLRGRHPTTSDHVHFVDGASGGYAGSTSRVNSIAWISLKGQRLIAVIEPRDPCKPKMHAVRSSRAWCFRPRPRCNIRVWVHQLGEWIRGL